MIGYQYLSSVGHEKGPIIFVRDLLDEKQVRRATIYFKQGIF